MGKIKQGILGGFSGKVGTVVGSFWNGIFYIKGLPQSYSKNRSSKQTKQQNFFKALVELSCLLTKEDLEFIYPRPPKGMTRRNMLGKQLATFAVITDEAKTVDLADINSLGNASKTDLPEVRIDTDNTVLQISWDGNTEYRQQHASARPVIFFANITQKKLFLVLSKVSLGKSEKQSFELDIKPYGKPSDTYSGFMFVADGGGSMIGQNNLTIAKRPAQAKKKHDTPSSPSSGDQRKS